MPTPKFSDTSACCRMPGGAPRRFASLRVLRHISSQTFAPSFAQLAFFQVELQRAKRRSASAIAAESGADGNAAAAAKMPPGRWGYPSGAQRCAVELAHCEHGDKCATAAQPGHPSPSGAASAKLGLGSTCPGPGPANFGPGSAERRLRGRPKLEPGSTNSAPGSANIRSGFGQFWGWVRPMLGGGRRCFRRGIALGWAGLEQSEADSDPFGV